MIIFDDHYSTYLKNSKTCYNSGSSQIPGNCRKSVILETRKENDEADKSASLLPQLAITANRCKQEKWRDSGNK